MLRLVPPGYLRFSQTNSFLTRVPSNDIGECALMEMRKRGVETDHCVLFGLHLRKISFLNILQKAFFSLLIETVHPKALCK
jgi:sugar/nucleoside kinase (ribokinase family)